MSNGNGSSSGGLTAATVQRFLTPHGTLIFTLTSNGYKFLTLNLVRMIQALRVPWTLCIICADAAAHTFFTQEGIPCIRAPGAAGTAPPQIVPFGTRQFQQLNRMKLTLLTSLINLPEVRQGIYLDGDIAVYRDFVPDAEARLAAAPDVIMLQCDERSRVDCSGTSAPGCPILCTGLIAWAHGVSAEPFRLGTPEAEAVWSACPEDQPFVNRRLAELGLAARSFPRSLYPNGAFTSLFSRGSTKKGEALLLHYNYLVGDMKPKKMRANGDWIIPY